MGENMEDSTVEDSTIEGYPQSDVMSVVCGRSPSPPPPSPDTWTCGASDRSASPPRTTSIVGQKKGPRRKLSESLREEVIPEKRQPQDTTSMGDNDSEPAYYVKSKRRRNADKNDLASVLEGRTDMLKELTSSVSTMAKSATVSSDSTKTKVDTNDLWCQILAEKLRMMDRKTAERFKLFVDTNALDAMEGDWYPTR